MEKIAIFVDVQNIYYTTMSCYKAHFDYNVFWRKVTHGREVVKAIAYAIDRGDEKQRQFQNILRGIGFEVKLKPYIQRKDGSAKGDWDVGITIDIMSYAPLTDTVILASGDGDFDLLMAKVNQSGHTQTEVYGVEALTAKSLQHSATKYIPIQSDLLLNK